jgi:hypothetical protein
MSEKNSKLSFRKTLTQAQLIFQIAKCKTLTVFVRVQVRPSPCMWLYEACILQLSGYTDKILNANRGR